MHPLISRSMPILLSIALASCSMPGISAPEIDTPSEPAVETEVVSGTGHQVISVTSDCEFVYKQGVYADAELAKKKTDKIMKFDGKIRKFSMRLPGNCADRRTSEDRVSFFFIQGFFFLPSGPKVAVLDTLSVPCCSQPEMKELVSPEIKRNPSGLDTKLQVFVDDSWWWEKSDDRMRYSIVGYADTLRFDIQEGLTEQNIAQATEEIQRILSTVEELPPEIPAFDFSVLDLPKTRIEGDAFILMDKNGGRKKLKIDTKDVYREMSPKEFEDYCRQYCSFVGMVGNRFFWKLYVADRSYMEVAMDVETGKLISKARIDKHDSQEK